MNTENLVNKMQRLKLEFLGKLYNLAQYNTAERFKILEVGRELGVDNSTLMNIAQHLHVKGFVELDIGGGTSITDSGIQVVEEIFTMRKSTYFPPTVVLNYINNVNNSQIQQSGNQSNQTIYLNNVDIDKVKEIIRNIEQQIDELKLDRKLTDELKEYIIDLKQHIKSNTANKYFIKQILEKIKSIIYSSVNTIVATILIKLIESIVF